MSSRERDAPREDRRWLLALLAAGVLGVLEGCGSASPRAAAPGPGGHAVGTLRPPRATDDAPRIPFPRGPRRPLPPVPPPRPGPASVVTSSPGGPGSTRQVALTIDDGYDAPTVAAYVDFATRTGIPITFSPNGTYQSVWNRHAARLRPLVEAGQVQIGNHTFTHRSMVAQADADVRADVERNEEWIVKTFGITSRPWLRPPYGFHDARTDALAGSLGYTRILMWAGSFGDSALLTPQVLMQQAERWLTGGRIVLGHANHPTVTTLYDRLLALIHQRGLRPVTLDTMFGTSRARG